MSFRDSKHRQHGAWASNGNIAVYIFVLLFVSWLGFQIWARLGGQPSPPMLDDWVMAALGVAVAGKSVERNQMEAKQREDQKETKERVWDLEELARLSRPDVAERKLKPPASTTEEEESGV